MSDSGSVWPPPLFHTGPWQMLLGERAALEGLLATLRPALAIEIGTAEGGSLARITEHSGEVHTIDIEEPDGELPPNVHHHLGDSREVLPVLLDSFARERRNVDFVLVDGDHSTPVIQEDLENLLASPAVGRTLIVLHDTMNEGARQGIENAKPREHEKVRFVDLDFVTGVLVREPPFEGELWGGFGVIVVDDEEPDASVSADYRAHAAHHHDAYSMIDLVAAGRRRGADSANAPDAHRMDPPQSKESAPQSESGGGPMNRARQLAPLSGIAFLVVAIVGAAIGGEPPSADDPVEEIVSHYTDNDSQVMVGAVLEGLAAALLIAFGATLAGVFRYGSAPSDILPSVVLAGAIVVGTGLTIDGAISFALADKADEIEPSAVQALQALWDNDFLPIAMGNLLFIGASGLAILKSGALPRWLGWPALVFAVLTPTPIFFVGLIGTALWILVVSVLLTRQARAAEPPPPAAA